MQPQAYVLGQLIVIILTLGVLSLITYGLGHVLDRFRLLAGRATLFRRLVLLALVIWLVLLGVLSWRGFFAQFDWTPPSIVLVFVPPLFLIIALMTSRVFRLMLRFTPMAWLVYAQSFRLLLDLFLYLGYRGDYVPIQMTFAWLNYDIIVGATAPMAGYIFFAQGRYHRLEAIWWNLFGVLLLLNSLWVGFFSLPTGYQVFRTVPDTSFAADFPFIWIPGFLVPFALALHIFSLFQLFRRKGGRRRTFSLRK